MGSDLVITYWIGILIRYWIIGNGKLEDRVEVSTPLNSMKRLIEGLTLDWHGVDPYSGHIFHESPLTLKGFAYIYNNFSKNRVNSLFIICDILTAFLLGKIATLVLKGLKDKEDKEKVNYHKDSDPKLLLNPESFEWIPKYASLGYLFNPYIIANCGARTTTTFANLVMALFLFSMFNKSRIWSALFLAFSAYLSFYPIMLIIPLTLVLKDNKHFVKELGLTSLIFSVFLGFFIVISYKIMGDNWSFIPATYGFILSVPELTPNMGLFWYFFTEMFQHFRLFFVCTFQINVFIYLIPLSIKLKNQPYLLSLTLIALIAIFKSYPSYGDVGFYLSLLPMVFHLFNYMKQLFIVVNMLIVTTVLGPILYQLWIYNGSANANYFFAMNLVFGTAQIFIVTDLLFANVKHEFYKFNGYKSFVQSKKEIHEHQGEKNLSEDKKPKLILQ